MTWHIDGDAIYEPGSEPGDIVCVRPGPEYPESDARWEERAAMIVEMKEALSEVKRVYDVMPERYPIPMRMIMRKVEAALSRATAQPGGEG